jgi:hypothetical protein
MLLSFFTATESGGYGGTISKAHPPIFSHFLDVRRVVV